MESWTCSPSFQATFHQILLEYFRIDNPRAFQRLMAAFTEYPLRRQTGQTRPRRSSPSIIPMIINYLTCGTKRIGFGTLMEKAMEKRNRSQPTNVSSNSIFSKWSKWEKSRCGRHGCLRSEKPIVKANWEFIEFLKHICDLRSICPLPPTTKEEYWWQTYDQARTSWKSNVDAGRTQRKSTECVLVAI